MRGSVSARVPAEPCFMDPDSPTDRSYAAVLRPWRGLDRDQRTRRRRSSVRCIGSTWQAIPWQSSAIQSTRNLGTFWPLASITNRWTWAKRRARRCRARQTCARRRTECIRGDLPTVLGNRLPLRPIHDRLAIHRRGCHSGGVRRVGTRSGAVRTAARWPFDLLVWRHP
jgi:hypothetical protein